MDSNQKEKGLLRNNPIFIITIACLVAAAMSTVGFLAYYHSETRRTVEQIQINNQQEEIASELVPAGNELDGAYVDTLEDGISKAVQKHGDESEFSASELTDSALGL